MIANQQRLEELLEKFTRNEVSQQEFDELCERIKDAQHDDYLMSIIENGLSKSEFVSMDKTQLDAMLRKVLSRESSVVSKEKISALRHFDRSTSSRLSAQGDKKVVAMWKRWAVAASVVGLLLVGGYWFFERTPRQARGDKEVAISHDVPAPTIARATLKLANGNIVYLDSVGNGQLAMQGNVSVVKTSDGQLMYNEVASSQAPRNDEIKYNTVFNPRGSKVQPLTLIDGTQVWLNAESSITYPTAFVGNERKVTMTGEAYFEVKHDATKKFIVDANGTTTQVLGTHFNVNAYSDEDAVRVTLLEGSVRLTQNAQSKMLEPGEQGIANPSVPSSSSGLRVTKDVDVEEVMAWKNGMFSMHKADIGTIMRQISRWYDVDIEYENGIPKGTISGDVSRNLNLSDVLKVYEYSGVHFTVEGKKIVVKP